MRILFYFGHPAQYLFLKNPISILKEKGVICDIVIKSKDVLEKLLIENKESYINILPEGRISNKIGILVGLIKRDARLFNLVSGKCYDLFIGTDPSLAHIGFLKRIPIITVLEDDIQIISKLAKLTYPFTSTILTPKECQTGKFETKTIHYEGYMKLSYLHPNRFEKKPPKIKHPYILIRVSKLDAHHDSGISGLNPKIITKIIQVLHKNYGDVYVSSEGQLDEFFIPYELHVKPSDMQQILANARMLISDSQSMSVEAAMLGIPSIRYSDFAGKISVLEELEHHYGLTYGIPANSPKKLFEKIDELISLPDLVEEFQNRRQRMLADKIDVSAFLVWFIENYPQSVKTMKENPDYQFNFK